MTSMLHGTQEIQVKDSKVMFIFILYFEPKNLVI